jgi:hypothetical protein
VSAGQLTKCGGRQKASDDVCCRSVSATRRTANAIHSGVGELGKNPDWVQHLIAFRLRSSASYKPCFLGLLAMVPRSIWQPRLARDT